LARRKPAAEDAENLQKPQTPYRLGFSWGNWATRIQDSLFLDDTHHLKHFRSLEAIRSDPDFRILKLAQDRSWVIATHN
jgi:hypothetical protein